MCLALEINDISLYVDVMSLPAAPLALSDEERAELVRLLGSGSARMAARARIVLACAAPGAAIAQVAADLGVSRDTVAQWRRRFAESGLSERPRSGRPKAGLVLTDAERNQLTRWARRGKTPQALALRARIVLACAEGMDNKAVAAGLRTTEHTVARWRRRFVRSRLDGLHDEPHPAGPG